ncbi:reverse transcriptase (RNA-dependent DNA polymerase) domain-containing protein [Phthorimaea operculella]|nr:reverse transcriptase (RNA-dependent DNA polymerase) domain-containing protein [Phthorimaea operculella]
MHNFIQLIDTPTHNSGSLLDHAYTNLPAERVTSVSVVDAHLTDHIAQRIGIARHLPPTTRMTAMRTFSQSNKTAFRAALESIDWCEIAQSHNNDCNLLTNSLINILINKFDICFPIKIKPIQIKPTQWIDADVINLKNVLFDILNIKSKFPDNNDLIKISDDYQVKYNSLLKSKRTQYFNNLIRDDPNKGKCMWRVINIELGRGSRDRLDYTDLIRDSSGQPYPTKIQLVNALNREFATAASKCGAPPADAPRAVSALCARAPASEVTLRITPFSADEIFGITQRDIAPKNSTDLYGLSASILKTSITPIACTMALIFNDCIRKGAYPQALKKVKISPLYKGKGKKADLTSYRPISLVPVVSKVFEVGLNKRLLSFVTRCEVLSDRQYAYRPGRATTDLVREVVWRVLSAREAGRHAALVCCDLSRAFDTADHSLIAEKLSHYGIQGPPLSLLVSFMSYRSQVVVGDKGNVKSDEAKCEMGVPQGSCLSNTLFSLLLNDLPLAVTGADIFMYADDVAAIVTAPTASSLEPMVSQTVQQLEWWFRSNGLALNRDKTCVMTFCLNGRKPTAINIPAGSTILQQVQCTKLLGFHLDSALVWETHIDELCKRIGRACFALRRLANTASKGIVRACYYATVHSNITYGLELWGRAADFERAFVMQKRAIRAMVGIPDDESCKPFFVELGILPLPCELIYQVAMFTATNLEKFKPKPSNLSHNLRSNNLKNQLLVPRHKLSKSQRSVYVLGPMVYNRLPDTIKDAASTQIFKTKLKSWLREKQFYDFKEFVDAPLT